MRQYKSLLLLAAMLLSGAVATAQQTYTVGDTIYNPKIVFTAAPSRYEIAGMRVEGVDNYEDNIIIGYSGLALGQRIRLHTKRHRDIRRRDTVLHTEFLPRGVGGTKYCCISIKAITE